MITAVESTNLATVGYDDSLGILELVFRSGAIYRYFGVPAAFHEELLGAGSKGSYFNRFIRGHFPYRLIWNRETRMGGKALRSEGVR